MQVNKQYGFWQGWWMALVGGVITDTWKEYSFWAVVLLVWLAVDNFVPGSIVATVLLGTAFLPWALIDRKRASWYVECNSYMTTWRGCGHTSLSTSVIGILALATGNPVIGAIFGAFSLLFGGIWGYGWHLQRKQIAEALAVTETRAADEETRQMSDDAYSSLTKRHFPRNVD